MRQGLYRFFQFAALSWMAVAAAPNRWVLMDLQRLPVEQVLAMAHDDLGGKYFATYKGLTYVDKSDNYQIFTKEKTGGGLGSDSVVCLSVGRYRDLWVGTAGGGLSVFNNGQWKHYTRDSTRGGLPDDGVLALALYREEKWIGTRNGFAMLRGNVWTTYTGERISGRLPNRVVNAIAVDSSGDKWIGTIGGLVKFTGSTWTLNTVESTHGGLPHNSITYLAVDSAGSLWVGTQAGVARMSRDGKWTNFQTDARMQELAKELTYSLDVSAPGEVWACIRGGSVRFKGDKVDLFTKNTTTGLQTRYIYYAMPGREQEVWFATERGVTTMYPPQPEDDN